MVCVGNEWYRFPSSFFLPAGTRVEFVRDGFDGQLPAHYSAPLPAGTRAMHAHFNDRNQEEAARYVRVGACDALVDILPIPGADDERARRDIQRGFQTLLSVPFLDASRSPGWSRALYVPLLSGRANSYAQYAVMARTGGRLNVDKKDGER